MKKLQLVFIISILGAGCFPGALLGAPDQLPAIHNEANCRQCHNPGADTSTRIISSSQSCLNCHSDNISSAVENQGFHGSGAQKRCLDCHSYHEPDTIRTTRGTISLASLKEIDPGHCASCHNGEESLQTLSEAHLAAATLYHEQASTLQDISPSQACLNCHSNTSATAWQTAFDGDVLEFREHSSHPFEIKVNPGQGSYAHRIRRQIDSRIPLFDGKIQCQTCHQLNSKNTDLIVAFEQTTDLCLGCHQFRDQSEEQLVATLARP